MEKHRDEITLKGLINIFLPLWWIILIVSVLCAAILGGMAYVKKDTYTSTAKYMISKVNFNDNNAQTGLTTAEVDAMHIMISNASEMINTSGFAQKVNEKLDLIYDIDSYTDEEVRKMMSISLTSSDTTCYNFSVTSSNPKHSYAIVDVAGELLVDEFANKTVYAVKIARIDDPNIPASPNSKNVSRNAVIGFAGGFIAAAALVFVISRFDVVIRGRDKIEENFDIPILGVIPRYESES